MADDFLPKPKKRKPVREKKVEAAHRDGVKAEGGLSLKWVSPGYAGVPDRIDLNDVDAMGDYLFLMHGVELPREVLIEALSKAISFTELKAPGKKPTGHQERCHARLRARGFTVNVVDQVKAKS